MSVKSLHQPGDACDEGDLGWRTVLIQKVDLFSVYTKKDMLRGSGYKMRSPL